MKGDGRGSGDWVRRLPRRTSCGANAQTQYRWYCCCHKIFLVSQFVQSLVAVAFSMMGMIESFYITFKSSSNSVRLNGDPIRAFFCCSWWRG